jgi:hypothetical protein
MIREPRAVGSFGARAKDRNRAERDRTNRDYGFVSGEPVGAGFVRRVEGDRNQVDRGRTKRNGGFVRQGLQGWTTLELGSFGASGTGASRG